MLLPPQAFNLQKITLMCLVYLGLYLSVCLVFSLFLVSFGLFFVLFCSVSRGGVGFFHIAKQIFDLPGLDTE